MNKIVTSDNLKEDDVIKIVKIAKNQEIASKGGNNTCVVADHNGKKYAVLKTRNMECYNFDSPADKSIEDEIILSGDINFKDVMFLTLLHKKDNAVPILGFCYDTETVSKYNKSAYAKGYIIQELASGKELFKDLYGQKDKILYAKSCLEYVKQYSKIPPEHFRDFLLNAERISKDLMIDPSKSTNFFYDEEKGFSFIDLNFHCNGVLSKVQLANYILNLFRDRRPYIEFETPEQEKEYRNYLLTIYGNIKEGFLSAGLTNEECDKLFEKYTFKDEIENS